MSGPQPLNIPVMLPNGNEGYELIEEFRYSWTMADHITRQITVPKGFIYDGASVPRVIWSLSGITPDGLIRAAALVHDFIYRYSGRMPRGSYGGIKDGVWCDFSNRVWNREGADKLFARIMRERGVPMLKRRAAYLGVRAGGWASWKSGPARQEKIILNK